MELKDIMTRNIITKDISTPIWEVARIMDEFEIGFVPLTNGNKIVGVITDRDIVIRCMKENYDGNKQVLEFMTKQIITVDINDSVNDVFRIMAKNKIKRVLVKENNHVVGVICLSDIIMHYDLLSELLPTLQSIFSIDRNIEEKNVSITTFEL